MAILMSLSFTAADRALDQRLGGLLELRHLAVGVYRAGVVERERQLELLMPHTTCGRRRRRRVLADELRERGRDLTGGGNPELEADARLVKVGVP